MDPTPPAPVLDDPRPGDRIAEGRTAEVFAVGGGRVAKVLRPGMPERLAQLEADVARVVTDAGIAAPAFLGATRLLGRPALVYERITGPSMLDLVGRRPFAIDRLATRLAELHAGMHATAGAELPSQAEALAHAIERAGPRLGDDLASAALRRLHDLPAGDVICHGDLHPGNVVMTPDGPRIIDWLTASRGRPEADVARTVLLMRDTPLPAYLPGWQARLARLVRRRFTDRYLRRYAALRPLDARELAAWRLPVLAARLAEGIEEEQASVLEAIRAEAGG